MKISRICTAMTVLLASSAYPAQVEWNGGAERDLALGASQEKAREVFEFTNSGKDPISITAVRASCGCTVPEYSKNIVMPSSKGEITLEYHARPPGFGRTVSALVEFSDGTSSSLSWRIASANSTPAKQIPLVSWSAGDMSYKKITVEIPEGHSISGVVSPPEVTAEPGIPVAGKMEVKIIRKSPRPFWGAIMVNTVPPLDDGSARINVRAAP